MQALSDKILSSLEGAYGPVALNFLLTQTPEGAAPDHIREQWVGVQLPIRHGNLGGLATRYVDLLSGEHKENDEPVAVVGIEGMYALREAGKAEAAAFWAPYAGRLLVFRAHEGEFRSVDE